MPSDRTTSSPQGKNLLTGRIIMAHETRFVLRSVSGKTRVFRLADGSPLTARDLVDLARSGPLVTIEFHAGSTPGTAVSTRMFLGSP